MTANQFTQLFRTSEEKLLKRPLPAAFSTAVTIAGAGTSVGLITNLQALAWIAGIVFILLLVAAILLLLRRNREVVKRLSVQQAVLDHYARKLVDRQDANPLMFSYELWEEEVTVLSNGDGSLTRTFDVRVGSEPLDAFWNISNGFLAGTDVNSAQESVAVSARLTDQDGAGVELNVTKQWEGSRLRAFVHFWQDCNPGTLVRVVMTWEWPGLYANLTDGKTEPRTWKMNHHTKRFVSRFTIPKALASRGPVLSVQSPADEKPTRLQNNDGSVTYTLQKDDLLPGDAYGYLIQLP